MSNPVTITAPEGQPFIEITREFDAPVEAVFRAHEDPEMYRRWNGPRGYEMDLKRYEFSTGGGYRYVHRDKDGGEFAFNGVFHLVRKNEMVIQTFEYEGWPGVVSIDSMTLERLENGRTRLSSRSVFPTVEARDGMVASGMERGVTEGYQQLDELLQES